MLKMHVRSRSPRLSAGLERANIKYSFHLDDSPAFWQGRVKKLAIIAILPLFVGVISCGQEEEDQVSQEAVSASTSTATGPIQITVPPGALSTYPIQTAVAVVMASELHYNYWVAETSDSRALSIWNGQNPGGLQVDRVRLTLKFNPDSSMSEIHKGRFVGAAPTQFDFLEQYIGTFQMNGLALDIDTPLRGPETMGILNPIRDPNTGILDAFEAVSPFYGFMLRFNRSQTP